METNNLKFQRQQVYLAFYQRPKTMLQVAQETGILRANICRYLAQFRNTGNIHLYKKGLCPITKHRAGFYTTNPELFPEIINLSNTDAR